MYFGEGHHPSFPGMVTVPRLDRMMELPVAASGPYMIPPVIFNDADCLPDFRRHVSKPRLLKLTRLQPTGWT